MSFKHGLCDHPIYHRWESMRDRVLNKNNKKYKFYGGRGIRICDEWNEFLPFYEWANQNGFSKELELDRKDTNGNYEPSNCRFVTKEVNLRNVRKQNKRIGRNWGISTNKSKTYHVQVFQDGKLNHVGNFKTLESAIEHRDKFVLGEYKPKGIRPDKGVYKKPWGFIVHVVKNKKCYHVGTFKTKKEAIVKRDEFKKKLNDNAA